MCRLREMQNILAFFGCGTLMLHLNTTEKHTDLPAVVYRSTVYEEMPIIQFMTNTQLLKQQVIRETLTNLPKHIFSTFHVFS